VCGCRLSLSGEVHPADQHSGSLLRGGSLRVYHTHHCARCHPVQRSKDTGTVAHCVCVYVNGCYLRAKLSSPSFPQHLPPTPQLLDLPGIIEGAKDGKGRGRQVIAVARTCGLIFIILDVLKPLQHKRLIERELEGFGIRLNKKPPNIGFRKKDKGGINLTLQVRVEVEEGWRRRGDGRGSGGEGLKGGG